MTRIDPKLRNSDDNDSEITTIDFEKILEFLNNPSFYLKTCFLNLILNRINVYNKTFQTKGLDIAQLKIQTNDCFLSILELCVISKKLDFQELKRYVEINWENKLIQDEWFYNTNAFIENAIKVEPKRMKGLASLVNAEREEFTQLFKKFLVAFFFY